MITENIKKIRTILAKAIQNPPSKYLDIKKQIDRGLYGRLCDSKHIYLLPYILDSYFDKEEIIYVEIGVLWGGSMCLSMQSEKKIKLYGIDTFTGYYDLGLDPSAPWIKEVQSMDIVKHNIKEFNKQNHEYHLIQGKSSDSHVLERMENLDLSIDFLFIDGDHSYDGVQSDFYNYEKYVNYGGLILFDNYLGYNDFPNDASEAGLQCSYGINDLDFNRYGYDKIARVGNGMVVQKNEEKSLKRE